MIDVLLLWTVGRGRIKISLATLVLALPVGFVWDFFVWKHREVCVSVMK